MWVGGSAGISQAGTGLVQGHCQKGHGAGSVTPTSTRPPLALGPWMPGQQKNGQAHMVRPGPRVRGNSNLCNLLESLFAKSLLCAVARPPRPAPSPAHTPPGHHSQPGEGPITPLPRLSHPGPLSKAFLHLVPKELRQKRNKRPTGT